MSDGNGYDARGEDEALNRRVGSVEHDQIVEAAAAKRRDKEVAELRGAIYQLRDEWRAAREADRQMLEAIAATVGAL